MSTLKYQAKDRELVLTAFTFTDWQDLLHYYQYLDYYKAKADSLKIPELAEELPTILRECRQRKPSTKDLENDIGGIELVSYVVWLSARRYHKEITQAELSEILNAKEQTEVFGLIMELSGTGENPNPTQAARQAKSRKK